MASTALVGAYTIMDIVNAYTSQDGKGQLLYVANVLAKKCPFLMDMPLKASNQIMSNIGARVSYIPTPGTRRFNEGVSPSAAHSTPFSEPICMVEDYSDVDKALWAIQNDPNAWRQGQDRLKIEGMSQKMEDLLIYGSLATDPGGINGLATRFALSTRTVNNDSGTVTNVQLGGGSGSDTSSIWVIEWDPDLCYGIYPKNLPAGIQVRDLGEVTVVTNTLAAPKYYQGLRTHFSWYLGLTIVDERCVQRIANVETSGSSNIFDDEEVVTAINRLPSGGDAGKTAIYCSRSIKTQMDIAAMDKSNGYYTQDASGDIWGRRVTRFQGVPVRMAEMIDDTETAIS